MTKIFNLWVIIFLSLTANAQSKINCFHFVNSDINIYQETNASELKSSLLAYNLVYISPPVEKRKQKRKKRLRRKKNSRKKVNAGIYSIQQESFMHKKGMLIVAISAAILNVFLAFSIAFSLFSPIAALCILLVLEIIAVLILIYQTTYYEGETPAVFAAVILGLFNLVAGITFIIVGAVIANPYMWIAGIIFLLAFLLAIGAVLIFSGRR